MRIEEGVLIIVSDDDIKDGKFNIPSSVTEIGSCAFCDCISLKEITIPNSVTKIRDYAFDGCTSLEKITIPASVTKIGHSVFYGCTELKKVAIPDSITEIESCTFCGCTSLKKITIPTSVTKIGGFAFGRCTELKKIAIPASVTEIGMAAFEFCTSLEKITIPASVTKIGILAFEFCRSLKEINYRGKHKVKYIDGSCMEIYKEKKLCDITILKCSYFPKHETVYVAKEGNLAAHGRTIREAVEDLSFKKLELRDVSEHVSRIKEQGYVTPTDYRLVTGACRQGTDRFLKENGLNWESKMSIAEACTLVKEQWGGETFCELFS